MANLNINKVVLAGRLTKDPELKQTTSGVSVTSFSIAINRRYKAGEQQEADYLDIVAWRQTAEFITRYFRKGSSIAITGSAQVRKWTDNNGGKHSAVEFVVDEAYFVDSKMDEGTANDPYASSSAVSNASAAPTLQPTAKPNFEALQNDDDLPF
jgi:single-strand DNA-binding protein